MILKKNWFILNVHLTNVYTMNIFRQFEFTNNDSLVF